MRTIIFFTIFLISLNFSFAQNQNSIWMFGDSAGIDFSNVSNPYSIHSSIKARGSCASICDKNGNLQFYYGASADLYYFLNDPYENGNIWNKYNNLMIGGDSIYTLSWYNEGVVVPFTDLNLYYLFTIGVTSNYGLYYNIIDMSQDSGKGAVMQKNVQLENWEAVDCLTAIKHGNGIDWWIIAKRATHFQGTNLNEWYLYLVDSAGIHPQTLQVIGSSNSSGVGNLVFDKVSNKLLFTNYNGLIELYAFDRCTGLLSNPTTIAIETGPPFPDIWGSAISPSGQYFYISTNGDTTSYLYQYNLYSPNIAASRITIDSFNVYTYAGGALRLAPDNKIYYTRAWYDGVNFNFPYPDTTYNMYNMNLSVINDPDQPGLACNFTPFSFYLGGKRTYWGLPNNPDYELGPLAGSMCDTIVSVSEPDPPPQDDMYIYPNPAKDILYFNIPGNQKLLSLKIFDARGKEVMSLSSEDRRLDVKHLQAGLYLIKLTTKDKVFNAKFVKDND